MISSYINCGRSFILTVAHLQNRRKMMRRLRRYQRGWMQVFVIYAACGAGLSRCVLSYLGCIKSLALPAAEVVSLCTPKPAQARPNKRLWLFIKRLPLFA